MDPKKHLSKEERKKKEERKNFQEIVKNGFVGTTHMHMGATHMHMGGAHMWDIQEGPPSLHKIPR